MRPPEIRVQLDGIVVDNFAGGGGASTGITWALGRSPDIAINHDPSALEMHMANHPETRHYCENIWDVDPVVACGGKPVAFAWFSPDCKHFSKAKGGKPVEKGIRGLAWVVIRWAKAVKPKVIMLENVEEFQDWGPLLDDGRPCPIRKGLTFRRWFAQLRNLGYEVELKELRACDYGTPTIRKRLFVIARCDGKPIVWPEPTHGPGRAKPWRTAAECIDWSLPCPSIFDREKPLAEATLRRIARGMWKYVINAAQPFLVPLTHQGPPRVYPLDEPFRTITCAHRGEVALVAPTLIQTGYGEREGQAPRILDINKPLGTVVAGGQKHALVAAFLARHYTGMDGWDMRKPIPTITTIDHHSLVTSSLVKFYGTSGDGQSMNEPLHTITTKDRFAEVRAFLIKFYGEGTGQDLRTPIHTLMTENKFALVTVAGEEYVIVDIGMRMLSPRELFNGQGFPPDYNIVPHIDGKPLTKGAQVRMAGNSVCPQLAHALVNANLVEPQRHALVGAA